MVTCQAWSGVPFPWQAVGQGLRTRATGGEIDCAPATDRRISQMARTKTADVPAPTGYGELDLAGQFQLTSPKNKLKLPITLPGDVHAALLATEEIPDPYFGENETEVMWVNRTPWTIERKFHGNAGRDRRLPDADARERRHHRRDLPQRRKDRRHAEPVHPLRHRRDRQGEGRHQHAAVRIRRDARRRQGALGRASVPDPLHQQLPVERPRRRAHELRAARPPAMPARTGASA